MYLKNIVGDRSPTKVIYDISKIKDHETGENVYSWRYTFKRGVYGENSDYEKWHQEIGNLG